MVDVTIQFDIAIRKQPVFMVGGYQKYSAVGRSGSVGSLIRNSRSPNLHLLFRIAALGDFTHSGNEDLRKPRLISALEGSNEHLTVNRRHQARVAAGCGGVDAGHAFSREPRDVMRTAGFGAGA